MRPLLLALLIALQAPIPSAQLPISMEDAADDGVEAAPPAAEAWIRWATAADFDGRVPFCTGYFTADRVEANGSGWYTDYPGAGVNFLRRLHELTKVDVGASIVVRLDDPLLLRCPFLFMSDVGVARFTPTEIEGLRAYLHKGGFLWVDDFWGAEALAQWVEEFAKVWPQRWAPIPPDHPIRHAMYAVPTLPQVPNVGHWTDTRTTSERSDSSHAQFYGVTDEDERRLVAVASHNTDIADSWEEEGTDGDFFLTFSPTGYATGFNVVLYALTH